MDCFILSIKPVASETLYPMKPKTPKPAIIPPFFKESLNQVGNANSVVPPLMLVLGSGSGSYSGSVSLSVVVAESSVLESVEVSVEVDSSLSGMPFLLKSANPSSS